MRKSKPITGDYEEIIETIRENPGIDRYELLSKLCKNPTMRPQFLTRIQELVDFNQIKIIEKGTGPLSKTITYTINKEI